MATQQVLCKGLYGSDIKVMSLDSTGAMNIATSSALDVTSSDLTALGGCVAGTELQVDIVSSGTLQVESNSLAIATETTAAAMSAKLPATLGQTTKTNSLAVTIASDQGDLSVAPIKVAASSSITANQTVSATSSYTQAGKDTAGYARVGMVFESDLSDTKVSLEWSHDGSTWFWVEGPQTVASISSAAGSTAYTSYADVSVLAKYVRAHAYNPAASTATVNILVNLH